MDELLIGGRDFVGDVYRLGSWRGELPPATSLSRTGAAAMAELVTSHPAVGGGELPEEQLRLFGPTDDHALERLRFDSVGYLVAGAIALGMTHGFDDDVARALVHAAAAPDPESLLTRARLAGRSPFERAPPLLPEWFEPLGSFVEHECFAGVLGAVLDLGKWASVRPGSDATGISGLSATNVCPETVLTILGSGFGGGKPADVRVYVPVAGGGCREATVERWTNAEIDVRLPKDIGAGCVGFVRGTWAVTEPQRVTGELTACIGAAAEAWTRGFQRVVGPVVDCPPCLSRGENRIQLAGAPVVNMFRFTPDRVEPGGQPVLSWNVSNATTLRIDRIGSDGPTLTLPSPLPPVGTRTLAPIGGLVPVTGSYLLTAQNGCGAVGRLASFTMRRTPHLSVERIEVVQSIQKTDNSVRLVANRHTAVRVFVDSGITDGFDFGTGPGRVSGLVVRVFAESLDTGSVIECWRPWKPGEAGRALNRDLLSDSVNVDVPLAACAGNVRFRASVVLPGDVGGPPLASANGSVDVAFEPKPAQMLLPILITDPVNTSPPPTMVDFYRTLQGPTSAHPFSSFVVNPELSWTLPTWESPYTFSGWERLIAKIVTMGLLFQKTAVGGVRACVLAFGGYSKCGIALPRAGATVPSFVVEAGDTECCTHELAHCFGLLHVSSCGGEPWPYDGGLPQTISDPGLDIWARSIIRAGTSETMTYCRPTWPSVEHWDRIFDRIPIS